MTCINVVLKFLLGSRHFKLGHGDSPNVSCTVQNDFIKPLYTVTCHSDVSEQASALVSFYTLCKMLWLVYHSSQG